MALTTLACELALASLSGIPKENIAVIVATHFGEVRSTLDFLAIYNETQVASPTLFQNSLHNSTLGFAAIRLGITGPSMTLGLSEQTQGSLKDLVESFVQLTGAVIICFVDYIPTELTTYYLGNFPFLKNTLNKATAYTFIDSARLAEFEKIQLPFENFF